MSTSIENEDSGSSGGRCRDDLKSPSKISKHDSLYFENGNIVLLSLPTENIVTAFRVYKDFLVLGSPVFAGMFSFPSPPNTEEFENAPIVRLHDEARDLVHFLRAIYDPTAIPSKRDFYFFPEKVESTFKLLKKYQCEKLLKCMLDTLLAIWPRNLKSWDCIVDQGRDYSETEEEYALRSGLPEPCLAIRLAHDHDVPEILPAAFYRLFCLSFPSQQDSRYWSPLTALDPEPSLSYLSKDDLICLVRGSREIQRFMHSYFRSIMEPADTCQQTLQCTGVLAKFVREKSVIVDALSMLMNANSDGYGLCEDCSDNHADITGDSRTDLWEFLKDFFDAESGE